MTEKFTICLVHDKDEIQNIIDAGQINIALERHEIGQLQDALANGREEAVMIHKSREEYEREQMVSQIDTLLKLLNGLKQEISN